MTYFLAPDPLASGQTVTLEGEEAQHLLKSRRMKAGERFALQDPRGKRFWAEVSTADRRSAHVRILEAAPIPEMPPVTLRLWVAGVKDKASEWIVQKATELGVAELHFFSADYSPVSPQELSAERTLARWERIAVEACKQCDRQYPLPIAVWANLDDMLASRQDAGLAWVLDSEGEPPPHSPVAVSAGVTVLVGPEGGLSEEELAAALGAGFARVKLGPLILRTETAAIAGSVVALQAGS